MSVNKDFSGQVVIVTGSSSGIGEGTAIQFSKLGANVVVTGRNADNVRRVANTCLSVSPKGLKPLEVIADITNDEEAKNLIESTIKQFGKIDILVNNAGAGCVTNINDENFLNHYENMMRLNVRSVVYLTHLAVPYLEITKGNVICISSVAGLKPFPSAAPYCMAKSALDMFVKCLAIELGPKGIRVNGINSGAVKTNFSRARGSLDENIQQMRDMIIKRTPLGFIGEPQDIADTVIFLASNEAKFITGINMVVDGGLLFA